MPLKLEFKSGDKLMINGAVIENIGANAKLLVHNEAAILRNKEVLSEADEATPAARVYLALQCAYMFPDQSDKYMKMFGDYLTQYVEACPSAKDIGEQIQDTVAEGKVYKALKKTQDLIAHEANVLQQFNQDLNAFIDSDEGQEEASESGEPENEAESESA